MTTQSPVVFWLVENGLVLSNFPELLLYVFFALMALDIITGLLSALYNKKINSKVSYRGYVKKAGFITGILFGCLADLLFFGAAGTALFSTAAIMGFAATEGISIIENLAKMNISMPFELGERFKQITDHKKEIGIKSVVEKKDDGSTVIRNEVEVPNEENKK